MATVLPPPSKRQRLNELEFTKVQQPLASDAPRPTGSRRLQFTDKITGEPMGEPVLVPLSANAKELSLLVNHIRGVTDPTEQLSYTFSFSSRSQASRAMTKGDLWETMRNDDNTMPEEDIIATAGPEAAFRVKAVSRNSAAISGHSEAILTMQFSPATSSRMVSGGGDRTARIWNCDSGTPLHTLKGHTDWVLSVSYSPDGNMIATGSRDATIRLWNAQTGEPLGGPMKGHKKWISSIAWEPYHLRNPSRPRLASASKDTTVLIWDCALRQIDLCLSGHTDTVSCVRWGAMGDIYTTSRDKTIRIWSSKDGKCLHKLTSHAHWVNHIALSTAHVLRTSFFAEIGKVPDTPEERVKLAKSRLDKAATVKGKLEERFVTASDDNTMFLWNMNFSTSKAVKRMMGHQQQVNQVCFSPDGSVIASASFDNRVKLWNGNNGDFIHNLTGHVGRVYIVCFSADSRLLVSASKDTTCKVWDVSTGKMKSDLIGHKDEVFALDWSPDGEKVASGGNDKTVRLWRH